MKIEIAETQILPLAAAIQNIIAATDAVSATQLQIDLAVRESEKEADKVAELGSVELPSAKQVNELLISRERRSIMDATATKFAVQLDAQKQTAVRSMGAGYEVFRQTAGEQLTSGTKRELIDSLPPSVRNDSHLVQAIVTGSQQVRSLGMFLNPPGPSPRDDSGTILAEAARILALLRDLEAGNDIAFIQPPAR